MAGSEASTQELREGSVLGKARLLARNPQGALQFLKPVAKMKMAMLALR
jgi:hypothetical protein